MSYTSFVCAECGHPRVYVRKGNMGATGYARRENGERVCFACCAIIDRRAMVRDGDSKALPLYLTQGAAWHVSNWPGTLRFPVRSKSTGGHNMAGRRYDVWFPGPDGHVWHGTQYGDWTQIVHCKRTQQLAGRA